MTTPNVKTVWLDDGRSMQLLEDAVWRVNKSLWMCKKGDIIDGSSIPRLIWPITGSPFVGKHRIPSVFHDIACRDRTKPWKDVHRMYRDGCILSGVHPTRAALLYAGLLIGGPKW